MFEWDNHVPSYQIAARKLKIEYPFEKRNEIIAELKNVILKNYDEFILENMLEEFGSAFYPPGLGITHQQWLKEILIIFEEPIEKTKKHFLPKFVGEA